MLGTKLFKSKQKKRLSTTLASKYKRKFDREQKQESQIKLTKNKLQNMEE